MMQHGKAEINIVSMFAFNCTILMMCMWINKPIFLLDKDNALVPGRCSLPFFHNMISSYRFC